MKISKYLDSEDLLNRTNGATAKIPKKMNFFKKFGELQLLMMQHNAGLTASHPYASSPINWPFLLSGISFWTGGEEQKQIYLIGNLVGWWTCVIALSIYVGIIGADLLARRRRLDPIPDRKSLTILLYHQLDELTMQCNPPVAVRNRLWNSAGFFLLIWGVHYAPFFLMNRQLFVHHYLPSHLASAMIAGAVLSFVLSETINYPVSVRGPKTHAHPRQYADLGMKGPVVLVVFMIVLFAMFAYMAPLTYGTPG